MRRLVLAAVLWALGMGAVAMPPPADLPSPWHWERLVGLSHWHTSQSDETLRELARRYDVPAGALATVNRWPLDASLPPGSRVWVGDARIQPGRPGSGLLVNLPERRLDVILDGRHRASWPVTIGAPDWPTPTGRYVLAAPVRDPAWQVPASIRAEFARHGRVLPALVPPGPGNPLGGVWLGLGAANLGIHAAPGANTVHGSHGCLRLAPPHAWQLAAWWRPGLTVDIVRVTEKRLSEQGRLWCERHADPYRAGAGDGDALGVPLCIESQHR
jgi:L,D-transpeptidase ErfK/SrfK